MKYSFSTERKSGNRRATCGERPKQEGARADASASISPASNIAFSVRWSPIPCSSMLGGKVKGAIRAAEPRVDAVLVHLEPFEEGNLRGEITR